VLFSEQGASVCVADVSAEAGEAAAAVTFLVDGVLTAAYVTPE